MTRYLLIFSLFLITNQIFSQTIKWSLDINESFISYDGEHFLHSWSGKNEKIKVTERTSIKNRETNRETRFPRLEKKFFKKLIPCFLIFFIF